MLEKYQINHTNHTLKNWSSIFPTIWTYMIMLKNLQNNISVYGCSPIKGQNLIPVEIKWCQDLSVELI